MAPRQQLATTHHFNGAEIRVYTHPAQKPSRGVIYAVHGFRGDHHGLARIVSHLPHYTVVVPDLPGFGSSTSMLDLDHDVDGYAEVLNQLAEELQLGPSVHLLGHSFGSIVAAKLATVRSFASLILLNPISELALESDQALLSKLASGYYEACARIPAGIGEALLRSRLFSDAMSLVMTKSKDPDIRAYVREQHRAYFGGFHSRATLAQSYRASISSTVGDYSPALGLPTLMVAGREDELGTPQTQETLRASFADAQLVMLENVGHLIHYEKAPETAKAIDRFLQQLAAGRH
ncbi:alpha-beta hydrolase superfamily lysophospholipase [Glutamicibacter mysorens]|uniref:Alpha-beta hydrolase superfamily lysophospholipase n=1 Tax=Glutamicibacter mysorens TaxID=257984 RepID=A0ABX4MXE8_9MICC|nr:alpha/beta hydrolase [Glutamicibacter mysorens]PJJ43892.1 alpha-beta hydrolase superfamily lysophospholipase [Glutamicibacter mysorens]